ncbi:MAG: ATP-dependent Clp protease ATP-binding subunit, partial [Patescibacteria group bacterium]
MEFNIRKTSAYRALKIEEIFVFRFAEFFKKVFLYLFIFSFLLIALALLNAFSVILAIKLCVAFFTLFLLFWELSLFSDLKLKKANLQETDEKLSDAVLAPENYSLAERYNLAEFLSFEACYIIEGAIRFSKQKKIAQVGCASLFYFAVKNGKDIKLICYRMGMNVRKLQDDLKNIFEKIQKPTQSPSGIEAGSSFSEGFKKVILEAGKVSIERSHKIIGEKEILVALARLDELFKKILVEYDLKPADIENMTLWLNSIENAIDQSKKFWTYENLSKNGSLGKDWASGYTVILDQYSIDWRRVVSKWTFKEIIGNQKEIEQSEMVLAKESQSNVLLVGDPGVGRKSIVQAIAQRCYLGKNLQELNNKRVVELDMVALISQIQDSEKLEAILDIIFQEALAAGNVILVIDEIHEYVDIIRKILSKYLPMQNFQFIGITTYDGLHQKIEQNSSFLQYFRKIEVPEVSELETIRILQNFALELEQKHKILILYPSIREIVNLAGRYFPSVPFPKKALDVLDEVIVYVVSQKEKIVMPHHVAKIISDKTEIPVGKMEFKEKEVLLNLENLIHQRIINQSEAVKEISTAMRRARAGIASKKRPMGTFLFMGPTGVGKTETSKALAQIYFGSEDKMIRIDMSEFQRVSDIPRLIGAVSPVEQQGLLTTPVRENPFSLILLDEIEKAHKNILNLFLQVFDEGYITDGQGRKVLFTNTIIICTSNAGAETIFKETESGKTIEKQKLLDELFENKIFKPEFINHFDAAVIFHPLTKENLLAIAQLMLGSLKKNLEEKEIEFEITESLKEKIVELSYKPEFGAREMRRVIQDKVENTVAEA